MVDAKTLQKLEDGYCKLCESDSESLLKTHLTQEIFDKLKNLTTPTYCQTLWECVESGFKHLDSEVGIYAPDAESYTIFADIFYPIIEELHAPFKVVVQHPALDFGDHSYFKHLDPNDEYVEQIKISCSRSLKGYPFAPGMGECEYDEITDKVSTALNCMEGDLQGQYYPLCCVAEEDKKNLINDHLLFKECDRFLQAAHCCRCWPQGRGIYHNDSKDFVVWCNAVDHLRIFSLQCDGNLGEAYCRLVRGLAQIEKRLPFSHHDSFGFLTVSPANLGTTLRISVYMKLPKLSMDQEKLQEIACNFNLCVKECCGEHTETVCGLFEVSTTRCVGLTEFDLFKELADGCCALIQEEKC